MKTYYFDFEITHLCNKYCKECSHRIKTSKYKYLTISEYEKIYQVIKHLPVSEIGITGGEPLMHPQFKELINRISNDFISSRIVLRTNGKLLSKLGKLERNRFDRIIISWYKGFNDAEIKKFIKEKNVFITLENFIKLNINKILNAKEAKIVFHRCPNKTYRFVSTKVYACCLAESIERTFLKNKIHIDITDDNNWQENINKISLYEACQYCVSANSIKNYGYLSLNTRLLKQYILLNSPLAKYDFRTFWRMRRYFKNIDNWYKYQNEP